MECSCSWGNKENFGAILIQTSFQAPLIKDFRAQGKSREKRTISGNKWFANLY